MSVSFTRCKNCRFWEHHINMRGKEWHTCERSKWVDETEEIGDTDLAFFAHSADDHGLDAGIKTGPEFGCVLGEPPK